MEGKEHWFERDTRWPLAKKIWPARLVRYRGVPDRIRDRRGLRHRCEPPYRPRCAGGGAEARSTPLPTPPSNTRWLAGSPGTPQGLGRPLVRGAGGSGRPGVPSVSRFLAVPVGVLAAWYRRDTIPVGCALSSRVPDLTDTGPPTHDDWGQIGIQPSRIE